MNNPSQSPSPTPKSRCMPWGILLLLSGCCLIALLGGATFYLLKPGQESVPVAWFNAPFHGQQLGVGAPVSIQAIARDPLKITRMEFWVDGQLLAVEQSNVPGGLASFPLLTTWQPASPGAHTLAVRAFNTRRQRGQASIQIEAIQASDQDGDGTPDSADACPVEAGINLAGGCPDSDGDGIPNASDACPEQAGLPEGSGCPTPSSTDRDGDGVLDNTDTCPDEPGSPAAGGCPDADSDSIPDASDLCPEEPGSVSATGCPAPLPADDAFPTAPTDTDGDGVSDTFDLCPDALGERDMAGCPDTGAADEDGDGVPDGTDLCPRDPGLPEHGGCPPTGEGEDSDGDGIPDAEEAPPGFQLLPPWWFGELESFIPVELQAIDFRTTHESGYQNYLTCYTTLPPLGMERWGPYDLTDTPSGIMDLRAYAAAFGYSNTRTVLLPPSTDLTLEVECIHEVIDTSGGSGAYYGLGRFTNHHPSSDWNGQVFTTSSTGGDDGRSFQASYRLCSPACDDTTFPAPILSLFNVGGVYQLIWIWDGLDSELAGYQLYINGSRAMTLEPGRSSLAVQAFIPACQQSYEFFLTAINTTGQESTPSNSVFRRNTHECMQTVQVNFESLDVYNPPADEDGLHRPGPIYGEFAISAEGASAGQRFNACYCYRGPGATFWGYCEGLALTNGLYNIQNAIYAWIEREIASCIGNGCHSNYFYAPDTTTLSLDMPVSGELTIYGKVMDCDSRANPDDTIFESQETVILQTAGPHQFTLPGPYLNLNVTIQAFPAGP